MSRLTPKQKAFCQQYLVDLNGKQAAIRAGYSARTAEFQASRLLSFVKVQKYLQKLQAEARKRTDITKDEILMELASILRAKISDYLDFDGKKIKFKDFSTLPESQIKAVEGIRQTRHGIELKLHGKAWTVERICRILGFESPQALDINLDRLDETTLDAIINRILTKK
jgi:phage terminase small subunit